LVGIAEEEVSVEEAIDDEAISVGDALEGAEAGTAAVADEPEAEEAVMEVREEEMSEAVCETSWAKADEASNAAPTVTFWSA